MKGNGQKLMQTSKWIHVSETTHSDDDKRDRRWRKRKTGNKGTYTSSKVPTYVFHLILQGPQL